MTRLVWHAALILFVWFMLAEVCLARQVYLSDGGIVESQSAWRKGDKVFVKVNRDVIVEFALNEIDLRRTFPQAGSPSRHVRRKATRGAKSSAAAHVHVSSPVAPPQTVTKPVAKPTTTPGPVPTASPAPVTNKSAQPAAAPAAPVKSVSPPAKGELRRGEQEAAPVKSETALNKEPELMKKAIETQKSITPQPSVPVQKDAGIPLYVPLMLLAIFLMVVVAHWVIFERAGQAGWKCLVPFYNMYIMMEICGKPGWWMFLLLVPFVGAVIFLFAMLSLAKKFGKSELFGVATFLLPMIFLPVLAFGGSKYEG